MKNQAVGWPWLACTLLIAPLVTASTSTGPRGVRPELAHLYLASTESFQCLDGSQAIPFSHLNDDYCDCEDGSDEPGTAACGQTRFYCANDGFQPKLLLSSRVNDGICDCCDGSDEWASDTPCANDCLEMGRAAREEAERRAEIQSQGFEKKKALMAEGKSLKAERQVELGELEKELEVIKAEEELLENEKNEVEAKEKVFLDEHNAKKEEERRIREEREKQLDDERAQIFFTEVDTNQDGVLHVTEIMSNMKFDQNQDDVVSDEEANFFLAGNTNYDLEAFLTHGWAIVKAQEENLQQKEQTPGEGDPVGEDEDLGQVGEDDDYPDYEAEPLDEEQAPGDEDHVDVGRVEEEDAMVPPSIDEEYDEATLAAIQAADEARGKYEDVRAKVRDLEDRMNRLRDHLMADYGDHNEFSPLKDKCYEFADSEYIYKMCAFDYCSQKSKSGGGETRLGKWERFEPVGQDPHGIMKFTNGQTCWNGPARSTTIRIQCGLEDELKSVSEPSKCEYEMLFETPAACHQPGVHPEHDEL